MATTFGMGKKKKKKLLLRKQRFCAGKKKKEREENCGFKWKEKRRRRNLKLTKGPICVQRKKRRRGEILFRIFKCVRRRLCVSFCLWESVLSKGKGRLRKRIILMNIIINNIEFAWMGMGPPSNHFCCWCFYCSQLEFYRGICVVFFSVINFIFKSFFFI